MSLQHNLWKLVENVLFCIRDNLPNGSNERLQLFHCPLLFTDTNFKVPLVSNRGMGRITLVSLPNGSGIAVDTFTHFTFQTIQHEAFPFGQTLNDFTIHFIWTLCIHRRLIDLDTSRNVTIGDRKADGRFGFGTIQFIVHSRSSEKRERCGVFDKMQVRFQPLFNESFDICHGSLKVQSRETMSRIRLAVAFRWE